MNLMFRKHFREGGGGKSGGGGSKLQPKANRTKRSREMSGGQQEDIHYRTHLFFAPSRPGVDVGEGRRCTKQNKNKSKNKKQKKNCCLLSAPFCNKSLYETQQQQQL